MSPGFILAGVGEMGFERDRTDTDWEGRADRKTQSRGALLAPGSGGGRVFSNAHCIFVKVPAPDSAWQAPDTVELRVRILASGSVVPFIRIEPSFPLSPRNSSFDPVCVPVTFMECRQAELVKLAVPESWFASPPKSKLRMTCTGMRSADRTMALYGPIGTAVRVPLQVPVSPLAAAQAPVADMT